MRKQLKVGDKVVFNKEYQTWHDLYLRNSEYEYFVISKIMNHSQRICGMGYKIVVPGSKKYVVIASKDQIKSYGNENENAEDLYRYDRRKL